MFDWLNAQKLWHFITPVQRRSMHETSHISLSFTVNVFCCNLFRETLRWAQKLGAILWTVINLSLNRAVAHGRGKRITITSPVRASWAQCEYRFKSPDLSTTTLIGLPQLAGLSGCLKSAFIIVQYYVETSPCAARAYRIYDNRKLGTFLGCGGLTLSVICPILRPDWWL